MGAAIRDRLLKIYRLATEGATEGERAAAAAMLSKLLADHGLTLDDLIAQISEPVRLYEFQFDHPWERRLITQIVARVIDSRGDLFYHFYKDRRRKQNVVMYELTAAQAAEAARLYAFYRAALSDEFDVLLDAFIQKHRLFSSAPPDDADETPDAAVLMWLVRMQAMKDTLQELPDPLRRELTSGGKETR